ncbi:SH3 domain-containing protein [bacterium]|nr:SH3 domain-containing protein [bacterium]
MVLALCLSFPARGEVSSLPGTVAEVTTDVELRKNPDRSAESHGLLPKGTFVRVLGEVQDRFVNIEVELENGVMEGWVPENSVSAGDLSDSPRGLRPRPETLTAQEPDEAAPPPVKGKKRRSRRVPEDEEILMRRKTSFFYGAAAAVNYAFINASDGTQFTGMGFGVGGHIGFFADKDIPMRLEIGYLDIGGIDDTARQVHFGFIEAGVSVAYQSNGLEIFAKALWAFTANISNLPTNLNNTSLPMSAYGGPWLGAGAGYRWELSQLLSLTARGGYQFALMSNTFSYHVIGAQFLFDIRG